MMNQPNARVGGRILCVEDDRDLRMFMREILQIMGYEVQCAENGQVGIVKVQDQQPDLILMDIRMPVMDGLSAIRHLRRLPTTAETPIFVFSGFNDIQGQVAAKLAGADRFFAKPLELDKLDTAIQEVLQQNQPGSQGHLQASHQKLFQHSGHLMEES